MAADNHAETMVRMETQSQKAVAEKVIGRCEEIVASLSFQPVAFAVGECTEIPEGAMLFYTQALNDNAVTNEVFLARS